MTMIAAVSALLVATGLFLALLMALCQRSVLAGPPPPAASDSPPVSILKPLKGVDADLEENLRTIFTLDYPGYEVVLGTEDPDDPALAVARRVAAAHPDVRSVILSDLRAIGFNPKVNNLANLLRRARHPLILISDSNIRVRPGYLRDLVAHRARSGAGLVWSVFRGIGEKGLGGALEALQLNVPVMGGVSGLTRLLRIPCAVGKSMLMHRDDLETIGGLEFLAHFLAEDQVCAEELAAGGRPVVLSGHLIDNILGRRTLKEFAARHLRWARLRRCVNFPGYLGEVLLNPVFLAIVAAIVLRTRDSLVVAGLALAAMSVLDASSERILGIRRRGWTYPLLELALSLARGVLWFVPLFSTTVVWRSNVLKVGPRTRIELKTELSAPAPEEGMFDTRERHVPA